MTHCLPTAYFVTIDPQLPLARGIRYKCMAERSDGTPVGLLLTALIYWPVSGVCMSPAGIPLTAVRGVQIPCSYPDRCPRCTETGPLRLWLCSPFHFTWIASPSHWVVSMIIHGALHRDGDSIDGPPFFNITIWIWWGCPDKKRIGNP